jgi:hypothetical protein
MLLSTNDFPTVAQSPRLDDAFRREKGTGCSSLSMKDIQAP